MPSITTSRIYIVDVESDPRAPRIHKVRITKELRSSESISASQAVVFPAQLIASQTAHACEQFSSDHSSF